MVVKETGFIFVFKEKRISRNRSMFLKSKLAYNFSFCQVQELSNAG